MPVALPAVMAELGDLLDRDAMTVTGPALREQWQGRETWDREVIRPLDDPVNPEAGFAVLRGNLGPRGAVVKPVGGVAGPPGALRSRARLRLDRGLHGARDDPELDVARDTVMVLRVRPEGYPGMPEVGNMPLPRKILARGSRTWCGSRTPG